MGLLDFFKKKDKAKKKFNVGDALYGTDAMRKKPMDHLANLKQSDRPIVVNPHTIDNLNKVSGVTNLLNYGESLSAIGSVYNLNKTEDIKDFSHIDIFKNYSNLTNYLKNNNFNENSDNLSERWLAFLKDNLDYLNLDKSIDSLNVNESNNIKDRLYKNSPEELEKHPEISENVREKIKASYNNKALVNMNPNYKVTCNVWMRNNFFRKTSKLGIDFFIKEKKNIHFVLDLPEKEKNKFYNGKDSMDKFADSDISNTKFLPITVSELRHINRKHGFDHPQIDFFKFSNNTYKPIRDNKMGYLKEYLNRREANKAKSYNEFLKPSVTKLKTKKNGVKPKIEDRPIRKKVSRGIR